MGRFQRGQEDPRQLTHAGGVAEIVLHEMLDRPPPAGVAIIHAAGDFDLKVEGQLILRPPRDHVQMAAHRPKEILRRGEGLILLLPQEPDPDQFRRPAHPVQVFPDPVERLQIAQPALALFHVRLKHIALAALALVPVRALCQLRLDEIGGRVLEQVVAQPGAQVLRQRFMPRDIAPLQKRGADRVILTPQADTVLHRPAGMADLQPHVPEDIKHRFYDAFRPGGHLPRRQEQKVHVGIKRHLGPAIATDGKDGDPLPLGRVRAGQQHRGGDGKGLPDDRVGQCGIGAHGLARGAGMGGEILGDQRQHLGSRFGEGADDGGALLARFVATLKGSAQVPGKPLTVEKKVARDGRGQIAGGKGQRRAVGRRPIRLAAIRSLRRRRLAVPDQSQPPVSSGSLQSQGPFHWSRRHAGGICR